MPITDQRTRRDQRGLMGACAAAAALALFLSPAADAATYTVRPQDSELVVRTFKAGIASMMAHDHVARATRFSGTIEYDPQSPPSWGQSFLGTGYVTARESNSLNGGQHVDFNSLLSAALVSGVRALTNPLTARKEVLGSQRAPAA